MGELAVRAEGLGKRYRIGESHSTLRESLASLVRRGPWRRPRPDPAADEQYLWALRDVSFEIERGHALGIIGRNGAGKSTLLKLLARITRPTEGCAEIFGRVASLLEVGAGFHPELTGRENVFLNGATMGMPKSEIQRKFDEIVEFAEIGRFIDTPIKRYSSGMYMRLAFSVAAHLDPDVLILDEVLSVGDIKFQQRCTQKMTEVLSENRTLLLVSHNLASVQSMCDRALVLDHGRVARLSSVGDAINSYRQLLEGGGYDELEDVRGIRVLSARIEPPEGPRFESGSPLVARMDFYTDIRLPRCYLNLHIEDQEGRQLINSRADPFGTLSTFDPGVHHVRAELPRLSLCAGMYALWFRLTYVNAADEFVVLDSDRLVLVVDGEQPGGVIDVPCNWTWNRAESVA